jgi:hypothetical protein
MQQIIEMLEKVEADRKADKEDLLKRMETLIDAYHEKRMTMFDAYEKRMVACLGQTEATEKIEPDPEMMQSAQEHQDILSEDVAVMPVKGLKKRCRVRKSTAGRCGEPKELT